MISSEVAIANLVYRYAELINSGDFEGTAVLFSDFTYVSTWTGFVIRRVCHRHVHPPDR